MRADERSVATPYRLLSARVPVVSLAALALVAVLAVLAFADASAEAMVTTVGPAKVGLQPRSTLLFQSSLEEPVPEPDEFENLSGNPVVSANKTYAIYWDPTDHYHGDWQHLIDTFFQSMGAASGSFASVFAVDAQYTDAANQHALYKSAFQGAYTDTDGYPSSGCTDPHPLQAPDLIGPVVKGQHTPVCLTDKQLQEELELFIAQHSLPKGMGTIYYLLTPPGVTACLDGGALASHCSDYKKSPYSLGESEAEKEAKEEEEKTRYEESFCSYHSDVNPTNAVTGDANTILYGVIPWTAGGLGDGHLTVNDEKTPAFACQDGGYDPSSKPAGEQEKKKTKTAKEIEEFEKKSLEEQTKQEEAEELEGPRQQEPNQVKCPSSDGFCDTGLADLIVNQISVEQQNIVTNPLLNAWQDPNKHEATDECRNWFAIVLGGDVGTQKGSFAGTLYNQSLAGSDYYLNDAFNLAAFKLPYPAIACLPGIRLEPQFTAPNPVNANEIVGFDGMESDITLDAGVGFSAAGAPQPAYAAYTWNFGDGSAPVVGSAPGAPSANSPAISPCAAPWEAPCAASAYHSYQYGGTYEVMLTVADVGGNTRSIVHPVTVIGPPAPSSTPSGGEPPGSGGPATTTSPAPGTAAAPTVAGAPSPIPTPAPVVTGFVVSKSLKRVVNGGLAVRYTANEQVAGSIQVLLDGAVAKRLGVHGPTAMGLPKGTPRAIVVGTAVLVTTKAGQGTIRVKFSSRTAAQLARTRKLKLTLRLFARNASRQSPQTTTVLSVVTLS